MTTDAGDQTNITITPNPGTSVTSVALTVSNVPDGVDAWFDQTPVDISTGPANATLFFCPCGSTCPAPGTYYVCVTGTSGSSSSCQIVTLTVST